MVARSTVVATRELKTRLSRYLRLVKGGGTVIVTDRGRPVGEIRPIPPEREDEDAVLEALAAQGVIALPTRPPRASWHPAPIRGEPFSKTLLDLREDGE